MNKYLRQALDEAVEAAARCSHDNLGYIQCYEYQHLAILAHECAKERRKYGYRRIKQSSPPPEAP